MRAHDGLELPEIGLGTYKLRGSQGARAVISALENGYRLLDSAFNYENEGAIGRAIRASQVPRDQIIVTSKLPGRHHARDQVEYTVEESVMRTGLDHIDLYLIHWPNPLEDLYVQAWQGLISAQERGLVKHIGVSNFLPEHIERLQRETGVLPAVNQIELHPYFPQVDELRWNADHGIITEAWSPVGRGNDLKSAAPVVAAATAHGATPTQILLAWHLAIGSLPLPKSANSSRQAENLAAAQVELTPAEVEAITALGRPDGRLKDQDPRRYQEF
ncbi:aldo/keto reductase [Brevibacterium sp. 50QC2O2]|uniref:aldo/keto reductase n=1 Tax=Brevibacterium TaxID=1696 RepID=UPI00211C6DFC|nr:MULTISPECIES: aldo/keto reductase [unclassified Brevibacterium]MCQ9384247.1 aldo/keto reductase [Brevibacterium sp. 68QC2CO]MCQ9388274.1 aldo/keto reductase [Brevibacterium sp. 50QC2O2]